MAHLSDDAVSELQSLINSVDLARMLDSAGTEGSPWGGRRIRSRSWLASSGSQGGSMLAQFGLSRSEVERWMCENGQGADMKPTCEALRSSLHSNTSWGRSSGSSATWIGDGVLGTSRLSTSRMTKSEFPLAADECPERSGCTMGAPAQQAITAQPCRVHQDVSFAQQRLHTFESQVRFVAQESMRLKAENLIDAKQLESVFGKHGLQEQQHTSPRPLNRLQVVHAPGAPSPPPMPQWHYPSQAISTPQESVCAVQAAFEGARLSKFNRRRNHRMEQTSVLQQWFDDHTNEPYPSQREKIELARQAGMEVKQVEHWFTNRRKRHWSRAMNEPTNSNPIQMAAEVIAVIPYDVGHDQSSDGGGPSACSQGELDDAMLGLTDV